MAFVARSERSARRPRPETAAASADPTRPSSASATARTPALGLFQSLSGDVVDRLFAEGSQRRVSRGEILYYQGESVDHLYVVESGSFKQILQSNAGKELIVSLAGPGDVFGAFGERGLAEHQVQALERAHCVSFPARTVRRAIDAEPELAVRLLRYVDRQSRRAQLAAARVVFETVPERLSSLIVTMSDRRTGQLRFPLNQTEIANIIGSSRETVCSILNRFQREGAIELVRGRIRVLERRRLP